MALEYRMAEIKDLQDIGELYGEFLFSLKDLTGDPYFDFETLDGKARTAILEERFRADAGTVAICLDGEKVVGFVSLAVQPCFLIVSSVREIGYIEGAYVKEGYRKRGILKRLESMVTTYCKERGLRWVELFTLADNQMANESWSRLGYGNFRLQWRKDLHG